MINTGTMCKKKKTANLLFHILFAIFFLTFNHVTVNAQRNDCTTSSKAGPTDPQTFNSQTDLDPGYGYVAYGDLYQVDCCGVVEMWEFSVGPDETGDVELQVWRPLDDRNEKFELVGVNKYTVQNKDRRRGYVIDYVDEIDQTSVMEGDVIGWYAPDSSLVEFNSSNYDGIWKLKHNSRSYVGSEVDFSLGEHQTSRTYGIQMTLAPNTAPELSMSSFSDSPSKTTLTMDTEVGKLVYVLNVHDNNRQHRATLRAEMVTVNPFFKFDNESHTLTVNKRLWVPPGGKTYSLKFKVTDLCGDEGFGFLDVEVSYVYRSTITPPTDTTTTTTEPPTTTNKGKPIKPEEDKSPTTTSTTVTTTTVITDTPEEAENTEDDTDSESGANTGMIIGIVIAVIIVTIIVIGIVAYCVSKKKKAQTAPSDAERATKSTKTTNIANVTQNGNGIQSLWPIS